MNCKHINCVTKLLYNTYLYTTLHYTALRFFAGLSSSVFLTGIVSHFSAPTPSTELEAAGWQPNIPGSPDTGTQGATLVAVLCCVNKLLSFSCGSGKEVWGALFVGCDWVGATAKVGEKGMDSCRG